MNRRIATTFTVHGIITGAYFALWQAKLLDRGFGVTEIAQVIALQTGLSFIVEVPTGPLAPSTVLPVQVFLWSDLPERGFVERTSGAIIVLLLFLIVMNATAVVLRNKFEKRW